MSIIKTDILQSSVGYGNSCKVNQLYNGRVWAWVTFNGETNTGGNCDIINDYNVDTVTDIGTGQYKVLFSTAHVGTGTSLAMFGSATNTSSPTMDHTNCTCVFPDGVPSPASSTFPIRVVNGGSLNDKDHVGVIFCGGDTVTTESFAVPSTWTAGTEGEDNQWRGVAYGNGTWVAVTNSGTNRIQYSKDNGVNWTAVAAPNSNSWYDVEYGGGIFVAMGGGNSNSNRAAWSTDGVNWTATDLTNENSFTASDSPFICSSHGGVSPQHERFVAVGRLGTNRVRYSSDGKTWSSAVGSTNSGWYGVCFGLNMWVAVASSGTNRVMYSTDATDFSSWTEVAAAEDNSWRSVAYGNGKFVAVAKDGTNRLMYSTDATSWSNSGVSGFDNTTVWMWIKFGGGYFIAGGYNGTSNYMYSTDGLSWSAISGTGSYYGGGDYSYDTNTFAMVGASGVRYHTLAETVPSTLVVDTLKTATGINTTSVRGLSESTIKAWIRFDASSGSPVIRNDYNIMAITDIGTGRFRLYFDTWMKSMSYHVSGTTSNYAGATTGAHVIQQSGTMNPDHVEIRCLQSPSTEEDNAYNSVLICGHSDNIKRNIT